LESASKNNIFKALLKTRYFGILIVNIFLIILFSFLSPGHRFISPENVESIVSIGPELIIIVLGVGLLMIIGEFDLSIGTNLVVSSYCFSILVSKNMNIFLALLITILIGVFIGFVNGIITVKAKIPSFITTLGTMMFWKGIMLLMSRGFTMTVELEGHKIFTDIFISKILGIPVQFIWCLFFTVFLTVILHFSKFGNWIYATGDNKEAARMMGINTDFVKIVNFMTVGFLCAFVAVMQLLRSTIFTPLTGTGWELKAIAACVVGGVMITGGIGNMIGIFLGAAVIVIIENALVLLRIPYDWSYTLFGLIIILSVLLDRFVFSKNPSKV
jgi:simple sugar transport system permease protein